jgi:hypothetical protein
MRMSIIATCHYVFSCPDNLLNFFEKNFKYDNENFNAEKISESAYKLIAENKKWFKFFITREQLLDLDISNVKTNKIIFMDFSPEVGEENLRKKVTQKRK